VSLTFDAALLARAWLSVALASGNDDKLPVLYRTVAVEEFDHGARLVATDGYVLLRCWVPATESDLAEEPGLDVAPDRTVVAFDPHGRAKGLLAFLLKQSKADKDAETVGRVLSEVAERVPDLELRADLLRALAADHKTRRPTRLTWPDGRRRAALLLRRNRHALGKRCQVEGCAQCSGGAR
jgi:hypothetical protein